MSTTRAPMPAGREMMAFLAYHDPLTGLANRTALEATLDEAIGAARASGGACALAFADLNDFKRVNDSLGHDLGDDLLCQVADRLRAAVRPGDLVARQGGDEFLVIIRDLPPGDRAAAEAVGQRIADAITASRPAAWCSRSRRAPGRWRRRGCCRCSGSCARPASRSRSTRGEAGDEAVGRGRGAGYSSLWRLRELPVQIIKVDRAFLTGVPGDPQATAVYAAILRLADACGCDVVAEGVEEAAHADFLADNGCLIAQGFHFGRPMLAADITALLAETIADDRRF